MRLFQKILVLFFVFSLCFAPLSTPKPALASSDINISVGSGGSGITIAPGHYPDLSGSPEAAQTEAAQRVVNKTKTVAQVITAVCALICFVFLFVNIVKLSTAGSIPFQRRVAIMGILWSGIAISLFGGAWVVVSFFWNFMN